MFCQRFLFGGLRLEQIHVNRKSPVLPKSASALRLGLRGFQRRLRTFIFNPAHESDPEQTCGVTKTRSNAAGPKRRRWPPSRCRRFHSFAFVPETKTRKQTTSLKYFKDCEWFFLQQIHVFFRVKINKCSRQMLKNSREVGPRAPPASRAPSDVMSGLKTCARSAPEQIAAFGIWKRVKSSLSSGRVVSTRFTSPSSSSSEKKAPR